VNILKGERGCGAGKHRRSLGIVLTHATQFDGPLFRFLAGRDTFDLTVYYTRRQGDTLSKDGELRTERAWDIDVRSGYRFCVRPMGLFGGLSLLRRIINYQHDLLVISGYSPVFHLLIALLGRLREKAIGLRSDTILCYGQPAGVKGAIKDIVLPCVFRLYTTGHPVGTWAAE